MIIALTIFCIVIILMFAIVKIDSLERNYLGEISSLRVQLQEKEKTILKLKHKIEGMKSLSKEQEI